MTQQSLITRLKAVEEALVEIGKRGANPITQYGYGKDIPWVRLADFVFMESRAALSDLRELIKEAEGQTPDGEWITVGNKLYFAPREKP